MFKAFASIADLAAEGGGLTYAIMEWIQFQQEDLLSSRSIGVCNVQMQRNIRISSNYTGSQNNASCSVLDPKVASKQGAPRKLRSKAPLELTSKKPKVSLYVNR